MAKASLIGEIFLTFLKLGCTSFGGPVAHLAFFNEQLVRRRGWMDQKAYGSLVGLCHFIPGPSSSQVGMGIGFSLAGWPGAVAAWLGFTLPSALLMALLAVGVINHNELFSTEAIAYLKIVALAVVVQAIWQMSRSLLINTLSRGLCVAGAALMLLFPGIVSQLLLLVIMGLLGAWLLKPEDIQPQKPIPRSVYRSLIIGLAIFAISLLSLAILASWFDHPLLGLFDSLYRTGALVFGGGHVVLPVLQQEAQATSTIAPDVFLAGYGLAQAMPGPLFTFAAYIGALWVEQAPWLGAVVGVIAIFAPSFILLPSILPAWEHLQYHTLARSVLAGVNVGVIALLIAVFYQPLFVTSITKSSDMALALLAFGLLVYGKCPAWILVIVALVAGQWV